MDEFTPELPGLSAERSAQIKQGLMDAIAADNDDAGTRGAQLAVWHYRDRTRYQDGVRTLCGIPWSRDPVGVVVPCEECVAEKLRRRDANRGGRPIL